MLSAFFTGLSGSTLTDSERIFLRVARPAGIILFTRNVVEPQQVRRLVGEAREAIGGDDILVLIDQEGGRVQRLRPPHWRALPEASRFRQLPHSNRFPSERAAHLIAQLTARDLRALGITCNCAPVLDIPAPDSHDIIGDRAYDTTVAGVVRLGRAVIDGYVASGVVPVVKHIPGHGRATADSHLTLPVVATSRADLNTTDFAPFKALADAPAAMTAHVVFSAIDATEPASTSAVVHRDIIRGHIGFDGLLMSDDLSMKALSHPSFRVRTEAVLAAGSDIALHCNGDLTEMERVAAGSRVLEGVARARFDRAVAITRAPQHLDIAEAEACLAEVLSVSV